MDRLYEFALCIKALDRELARRLNEAVQPLGITAAQADALVVIGQTEPVSLKALGELLVAEGGHPSRLVDRLVEAGLVERRPSEEDRRRIVLSLTPAGRRLAAQVTASREEIAEFAREFIPARELDRNLKFLRGLLQQSAYAELVARRTELPDG